MFKGLRFFSLYRRPLRNQSHISQQSDLYNVQRVRIIRPFFTPRRAQTAALYLSGIAVYWHYFIGPGQEDEEVTSDGGGIERSLSEGNETHRREPDVVADTTGDITTEDVQPDDAMFIPLGWARQCPMTFYKGSDPEWQSFVKLAQDKEMSLFIRNELAGMVGQHLSPMKQFQKFLGQPIQPGKFWLDIDFPDSPPPEYERGGLEITDNYIAWSTRPVTPHNYFRLQQALWPTAMSYSLWATYSALCSFYIAKFKHYFNLNPRVDHPGRPPLSDFLEFQRTRRRTGQQQIQSGAGVEQPSVPSSSEGQSEKESVGHPSPPAEADSAGLLPVLPSIPQPGLETKLALGAFKRTFARAWRPAPVPPPRGTCIISGLVELAGPKGMCVVDVRAAYHPGERRFVSIGLAVRRLQQRAQSPRGGP